jgi:hypothetical protein
MDKTVIVHIGLHPAPAETLRALPVAARADWVAEHLHVRPVSFETFESYGFLSCTLEDRAALPELEAAPEVDWIEIDTPMSIR